MPSLSKQVADKKAQEQKPRVNPEIDAKLDNFIKQNSDLFGYYNEHSKEQLIRKLMLAKMRKSDYTHDRNEALTAWVNEHPEIKAKVEERIKNVPEANRQRAFLQAARTEAMKAGMKSPRP